MSKISIAVSRGWDRLSMPTWYYNCINFISNLRLFIPMAWQWRSWDSHYSIDVLIKLLKAHAAVLMDDSHHKNHIKTARRCYTAAGLLDKAYNKEMDKTIESLMKRNPWPRRRTRDGYIMTQEYETEKRIYDGMYKAAVKRSDAAEVRMKQEAWAYINKYIEYFWS